MRAAIDLVARDEFDDGVVVILLLVPLDSEANPVERWLFVEVERRGSRGGIPGGEQIRFIAEYVGDVARTHECFSGGRRRGSSNQWLAAIGG